MMEPNQDTGDHVPIRDFGDMFFTSSHDSLSISFGVASHIGKVRAQNEDHFAVFRRGRTMELLMANLPPDSVQQQELYSYGMVVADGMGGMKSGEVASRLALQTMFELSGMATSWVMTITDFNAQQIQQRVQAYMRRVHTTLLEHGQSDPALENMGTTWTSAHFLGRTAVIVHVGDSRAYLFCRDRLLQITHDETMAQALIDSGMEADSVRKFRHVLLNSLGGGNDAIRATIMRVEMEPNDQLMLCTDGLTDMVSDDDIAAQLLRHDDPQAACDALVAQAIQNGGRDNITITLARVTQLND